MEKGGEKLIKCSIKDNVKIGDAMLKVNEKSGLFVIRFGLYLMFKINVLDN
jgi:hypothetical protein